MIDAVRKVVAVACVAVMMAGTIYAEAASPTAPRSISTTPLTSKEIDTGITAGLGCSFQTGKDVLFVIVVGEALAKPNGALTHFKIESDHSLSIINFGGAFGNSEWRVLIDRDDKVIGYGEEATTRKARLTFRSARTEKTVSGVWTCGA